jgi:hypothetical protein
LASTHQYLYLKPPVISGSSSYPNLPTNHTPNAITRTPTQLSTSTPKPTSSSLHRQSSNYFTLVKSKLHFLHPPQVFQHTNTTSRSPTFNPPTTNMFTNASAFTLAARPVEQCTLSARPVEQCTLSARPVEQCTLSRGPVEQCTLSRGPVEQCTLAARPVEQCTLSRA